MRNSARAWPGSAKPNSDKHPNTETPQEWDTPADPDIGVALSTCATCPAHTSCSSAYLLSHMHKPRSGTGGHMCSHAQLSRRRPISLPRKTGPPCPPLGWPSVAKSKVTYLEYVRQGLETSDGMGAPITSHSPSGLGEEDRAQNLQSLTMFHYESLELGFCSFPGESRSGESTDAWFCPLPSHQQSCLSSGGWPGPCRKAA